MGKAVGIDLGTTNSAVAIVESGKPVIIVNAEGDRVTPRWLLSPRTIVAWLGHWLNASP